jgi:glycosyltransferase involved in cell wall biosynthesis
MSRENPFLSCIVPAYNEAANIPHFIPALAKNLSELGVRYEIIVVDDGSKDNTLATLQPFLDQYPLKVFELSRNFGKEAAISAGLAHVSGNVTLLIYGVVVTIWFMGFAIVKQKVLSSRHSLASFIG